MKKIITAITFCLLVLGAGGCKQNDREYFDTDYAALNIWVGTANIPAETATYNFISHNDMDYITFHVRLTGIPVDYPRTFTLEAVAGHIGKVEFVVGECVLPAGQTTGSYPIYFAKPDNYGEFRYSDGYLIFKIKENEHFTDGADKTSSGTLIRMDRLHIVLQNSVTKPWNWDSDTSPYMALQGTFGSYSNAKYEFMINTLGISDLRIKYGTSLVDEEPNVITHTQAAYYATRCRSALVTFNEDPENIASGKAPLIDEYGFEVSF